MPSYPLAPTTSSSPQTIAAALRRNTPTEIPETVAIHHAHNHPLTPNQCCSAVIKHIAAPLSTIWSIIRRFDNPQLYKCYLDSCHLLLGNGGVGTLRQVHVVSGLPAENSTERLEILDDEKHVISFSIVGGEHRLENYRSVTTLHPAPSGDETVVVESYVVDVPPGNTKDETRVFVETIIKSNFGNLNNIVKDLCMAN